jgi:hypothetical protein
MEIHMSNALPAEWATRKPVERYETQFFYVGLSRYDTVKNTLSNFARTNDGKVIYTETPYNGNLARCYISEFATVTVYSHNPRIWTEDLGVDDYHVFIQKHPTHVS